MSRIDSFAEAQARHEGFYIKGSIAQRYNNPGNIVYGPLAQSFGATSYYTHPRTKHDFAIFPTPEQGWQALYRLIENAATGKSKVYSPEMTILEYASKYAPVRDEKGRLIPNLNYANSISKQTGLPITTQIKHLIETSMKRFIHPMDPVFITQRFGERPEVYGKFGLKGHNGIDYRTKFFDSPLGRRYIVAPDSGFIEETGNQGNKGYGVFLRIRHDDGSQSVLGHCTKLYVKQGDRVTKGSRVALSGNTGFSSGAHVHWGWRPKNWDVKNGYAGYVDQEGMIG